MEARKDDIIPRQADVERVVQQMMDEKHLVGIERIKTIVSDATAPLAERGEATVGTPTNAGGLYSQTQNQSIVDSVNQIITALRASGIIA